MCPLPRDDTLNTSFAEYLAFSLIFFIFYRYILLCPRVSAVRNLGARAPPALWRRRLWEGASIPWQEVQSRWSVESGDQADWRALPEHHSIVDHNGGTLNTEHTFH